MTERAAHEQHSLVPLFTWRFSGADSMRGIQLSLGREVHSIRYDGVFGKVLRTRAYRW